MKGFLAIITAELRAAFRARGLVALFICLALAPVGAAWLVDVGAKAWSARVSANALLLLGLPLLSCAWGASLMRDDFPATARTTRTGTFTLFLARFGGRAVVLTLGALVVCAAVWFTQEWSEGARLTVFRRLGADSIRGNFGLGASRETAWLREGPGDGREADYLDLRISLARNAPHTRLEIAYIAAANAARGEVLRVAYESEDGELRPVHILEATSGKLVVDFPLKEETGKDARLILAAARGVGSVGIPFKGLRIAESGESPLWSGLWMGAGALLICLSLLALSCFTSVFFSWGTGFLAGLLLLTAGLLGDSIGLASHPTASIAPAPPNAADGSRDVAARLAEEFAATIPDIAMTDTRERYESGEAVKFAGVYAHVRWTPLFTALCLLGVATQLRRKDFHAEA